MRNWSSFKLSEQQLICHISFVAAAILDAGHSKHKDLRCDIAS